MNKKINKNKLGKILVILALIAAIVVIVVLMIKNQKTNGTHEHGQSTNVEVVANTEFLKSAEDIFADNDFLIESFNEYEDGDRFYLAGTNLIDYDRMFVFFGAQKREQIVQVLNWNYEEIKDKEEDDVLVVFQKGNVLMRLFNMKESECGFNFKTNEDDVTAVVQSSKRDVFFKTAVENGIKVHYLDSIQDAQPIYTESK